MRRLVRCKDEFALLEGAKLVTEAARLELPFEGLVATPAFLETPDARRLEPVLSCELLQVAPGVLAQVAQTATPQGVAALVRFPRTASSPPPALATASAKNGLYLFLDRLQDPGNLGAVIRTAEATGCVAVALSEGCAHPNHSRALRASAGSLLRVPVWMNRTISDLKTALENRGVRVVALDPKRGSDLFEADLGGTLIVAAGSEGTGLSDEVTGAADFSVSIPMSGSVESLNATVATSLVLYAARAHRRKASPSH